MAQVEFQPKYRPDIDGLRAIAVLSVVVFHLFHGVLSSGFLGVDVFFVISGYLISTILLKECEQNKFSILRFYERRIRRIMPALLFMIVIVTLVAICIFLSSDLTGYAKSVLATFSFVSNIYFWRDTNYFSPDALTKPLLHTWSLGIEEQFYIFYPLIVYALAKFGKVRLILPVLILLSALSFAAAVGTIYLNKAIVAFYLLPMRAWELGLGSMVAALRYSPPKQRFSREAIGIVGAILLIGGLFAVTPGFAYMPPATWVCLGTALLIWSGREATLVHRLLAAKPLVGIGLISYSLYLWHWPIYVMASYFLIRSPGTLESALLVLLSAGAAVISWRFVEKPFRGYAMPISRVMWIVGIGVALSSAVAGGILVAHGLPGRFDARSAAFNDAVGTHYRCPVSNYMAFGPFYACPVNLPDRNPASADVVVLGNSHAQMYVPAIEPELARRGLHGLLVPANACLPIAAFNLSPDCLRIASANIEATAALKRPRTVILALSWQMIYEPMYDAQGRLIGKVDWTRMRTALTQTIHRLRESGKQVVLVGAVPSPGYNVASVTSREIAFSRRLSPLEQSRAAYDRMFGHVDAWVGTGPEGSFGVLPSALLCNQQRCSYLVNDAPVFADDNHLSSRAMPAFRPMFGGAIDRAGAPGAP